MKENKIKEKIIRYTQFVIGLFLFSFAFNFFLLPNNLVFGGVSGLSIVFSNYIDPSLFVLVVCVFLLFVSFAFLGKEMTARSVIGSLMLPLFMKLTEILTLYIHIGEMELLVAALYGGVLSGIGIGLVYKTGFNTGGTDIINLIINKYAGFSIGKSMFVSDGLIVLSGIFAFGIIRCMYAGIVLFLISKLSDRVILGISNSKAFYIVTDKPTEVKTFVTKKLGHGITEFNAKGGYNKETQKVLFSVVPTQQYYSFKNGLYKIDKDAFFVAVDAYESKGGK
jgi:uncharacterized membrane-anchored protein YitT (DUF2179 family)